MEPNYTDINAAQIDQWVEGGWEWGIPIDHQTYCKALEGDWKVYLTPTVSVPQWWFPKQMKDCKLLGLASGGGQQMPIFSAAGADCTVMDYSLRQLESEKMVAEREGYDIRIVRADMTKPFPFESETFDLIFHPVSNCYIKDVRHVWDECFRILKPGGLLMAGLDNGVNFLFADEETGTITETLPVDPLTNLKQREAMLKDGSGYQFSHTIDEQIGEQLKAGFMLKDVFGDTNGRGFLHEHHVDSFWATLARKPI